MGIPIPGATREDFDKTKTETGSKPFPFITNKWTNYTAEVSLVEIATDQSGNGNDQLVIRAKNGEYECRIYVNLDPNHVGPACTNVTEQVQKNIDRLLKVGKCLEIITWKGNTPEIEPKLFKQATGKIIEIGIQGAVDQYGQPKKNQKGYQVINTTFGGLARELKPVVVVSSPATSQTPAQNNFPEDIPF